MTSIVLAGLGAGTALHLLGFDQAGRLTWAVAVAVVLLPLTWSVLRELRAGRLGVDLIALLAMAGALATGEYLAGAVIALMLAGGNALEEYARGRAGRELSALVERMPREAHVRRADEIIEVDVSDVAPGDVVVVRAGEIVPVDGVLESGSALVDQAALTGEPLPVRISAGMQVMSGSANAANSFELRASRAARDSTYMSIVVLVEQAMARKAPMVRMADRYSVVFLTVTLVVAALSWFLTGDPVRALAVLVVATPCPLILAPPVALVAGTSRAARRGIIVKGSAAIERLGRTGAVLIDKTGTITLGTPTVSRLTPVEGTSGRELLRHAGSVEQMSVHSLAEAIAHAATAETGRLEIASAVEEEPGRGIRGIVDGRHTVVGSAAYVRDQGIELAHDRAAEDGVAMVHVGIGGSHAGSIELSDAIRTDAAGLAGRLRALGVTEIVMATGDHAEAAGRVAAAVGIDEFVADCTPQRKLAVLRGLKERIGDRAVVMVGDGVNDAPALAAADVGIAMGSAGATAASESAEAVILTDRVSLVADAVAIGRRSRRIAQQSIFIGMTLSIVGMAFAAAGHLPPVQGALTQEAIDLGVILNALRALSEGPSSDDAR